MALTEKPVDQLSFWFDGKHDECPGALVKFGASVPVSQHRWRVEKIIPNGVLKDRWELSLRCEECGQDSRQEYVRTERLEESGLHVSAVMQRQAFLARQEFGRKRGYTVKE